MKQNFNINTNLVGKKNCLTHIGKKALTRKGLDCDHGDLGMLVRNLFLFGM